MAVGRHGVEARCVLGQRSACPGQVGRKRRLNPPLFSRVDRAVDGQRIRDRRSPGVFGDLHAPVVDRWKPVEKTGRRVEGEAGQTASGMVPPDGRLGLIPKQRLAEHPQRHLRQLEQVGRPGTRCDHQRVGGVASPVGLHDDMPVAAVRPDCPPAADRGAGLDAGTQSDGLRRVGPHAVFNEEIATTGLVDRGPFFRQPHRGPADHGLAAGHPFDRQRVDRGRRDRAGHHLAVGWPCHEQARLHQQRPPCRGPQCVPEFIRPAQQRHIIGMLEIGEPDESRLAVGTAPVVARRKAVEPANAGPAGGHVHEGSGTHAARADHDRVEAFHGDRTSGLCKIGFCR